MYRSGPVCLWRKICVQVIDFGEDKTMTISEKILAIDWRDFDTAYGNAAEDIPYYVPNGDGRG